MSTGFIFWSSIDTRFTIATVVLVSIALLIGVEVYTDHKQRKKCRRYGFEGSDLEKCVSKLNSIKADCRQKYSGDTQKSKLAYRRCVGIRRHKAINKMQARYPLMGKRPAPGPWQNQIRKKTRPDHLPDKPDESPSDLNTASPNTNPTNPDQKFQPDRPFEPNRKFEPSNPID